MEGLEVKAHEIGFNYNFLKNGVVLESNKVQADRV